MVAYFDAVLHRRLSWSACCPPVAAGLQVLARPARNKRNPVEPVPIMSIPVIFRSLRANRKAPAPAAISSHDGVNTGGFHLKPVRGAHTVGSVVRTYGEQDLPRDFISLGLVVRLQLYRH